MRARTAGKIVIGALTVLFTVLCLIYAISTHDPVTDLHHGARAIAFGILALTAATTYRYFED